jgi:hypothetical protein
MSANPLPDIQNPTLRESTFTKRQTSDIPQPFLFEVVVGQLYIAIEAWNFPWPTIVPK